jgi:hypothetical protein
MEFPYQYHTSTKQERATTASLLSSRMQANKQKSQRTHAVHHRHQPKIGFCICCETTLHLPDPPSSSPLNKKRHRHS